MTPFAAIAAEFGIDERTARRWVEGVIAKLREALGDAATPELVARAIVLVLEERAQKNFFSTEPATISEPARRISDLSRQIAGHASRAESGLPGGIPCPIGARRAKRFVPRRFPPRSS